MAKGSLAGMIVKKAFEKASIEKASIEKAASEKIVSQKLPRPDAVVERRRTATGKNYFLVTLNDRLYARHATECFRQTRISTSAGDTDYRWVMIVHPKTIAQVDALISEFELTGQ